MNSSSNPISRIEAHLFEKKFKKFGKYNFKKIVCDELNHLIIFSRYKWHGINILEPALAVSVPDIEKFYFEYVPRIGKSFFINICSITELALRKTIKRSAIDYSIDTGRDYEDRVIADIDEFSDEFFSKQIDLASVLIYFISNRDAGGTAREATMALLSKLTNNKELFEAITQKTSFGKSNILEKAILEIK